MRAGLNPEIRKACAEHGSYRDAVGYLGGVRVTADAGTSSPLSQVQRPSARNPPKGVSPFGDEPRIVLSYTEIEAHVEIGMRSYDRGVR